MNCERYREAASVRLDDEPPGIPASAPDGHRARRAACGQWVQGAPRISQHGPLSAGSAQDVSAGIVGQVLVPARRVARCRRLLRIVLALSLMHRRRGVIRRLRSPFMLAGALLLAVISAAPPASAHAVVVSSDPADGARLSKAPSAVTVRFDEQVGVGVGFLRVVDGAGQRVDTGGTGHPGSDGTALTVRLTSGLGDGSYLASFRVTSADSHPIAGSIRFVVGNGPLSGAGGGSTGTTAVDRTVATGLAAAHWLSFAGVALVGGSWLIFSIWPAGQRRRSIRQAIWSGWGLGAAGAVGEFLLQGPYAAGSSAATMFRPSLLDATLHINAGQLLSLRMVLLGVLAAILTAVFDPDARRRPTWGPEAAGMVGIGIIVTYAATGHAQSESPRWFAVLVAALHLSAMVVWLGGLALLVIAAVGRRSDTEQQDDDVELAAGMPIFSRVALTCVGLLVVTGSILAWREVATVDAVVPTWYGRLVLVKVLLLAGLVGLGYFARRTVLRRDWTELGGPLLRMRRTLAAEVLVGSVVLGVSGVLIALPPGKVALAAVRSRPAVAVVTVSSQSAARVEVDPGRHGSVQLTVQVAGGPAPTRVTASASLPSAGLGPIPVELQSIGPRSYAGSAVNLPVAGRWQITVTVQTSAFDSTTAVATVRLS